MSYFSKMIKTKGEAIKCEAEPSDGGGHAGLIVLIKEDAERAVLGRTDPTFKTAEEAVAKMRETVEIVRNGVPEPVVEEPTFIPKDAPLSDKGRKKVTKKKRKTRKRKGARDDSRGDSAGDDGGSEEDSDGRKG